ncbi:MAG: M15 family metallopeptidase [Tannerella sp.]|jgi:D-alanyl-D-alanine dipeptidase|nr:M15 family metallopeptidase [Tannerella sp.]
METCLPTRPFHFAKPYADAILLLCFFVASCSLSRAEDWDRHLAASGFVDVQTLDTSIRVRLVYATPDNFMNKAVYRGLTKAWLHPDAARKLARAQEALGREYPGHVLLVYDAARPIAVQQAMWELVRGTKNVYYVANPAKREGRHNYGMAVDVTIADKTGVPLPMGTPFDHFGEAAHTDNETALLQSGRITAAEYRNRQLLRRIMRQAGFTTVKSEWWHFNACSAGEAKARYTIIE